MSLTNELSNEYPDRKVIDPRHFLNRFASVDDLSVLIGQDLRWSEIVALEAPDPLRRYVWKSESGEIELGLDSERRVDTVFIYHNMIGDSATFALPGSVYPGGTVAELKELGHPERVIQEELYGKTRTQYVFEIDGIRYFYVIVSDKISFVVITVYAARD